MDRIYVTFQAFFYLNYRRYNRQEKGVVHMELSEMIRQELLRMYKCSLQNASGLERVDKKVMNAIGKECEGDEKGRACRNCEAGAVGK